MNYAKKAACTFYLFCFFWTCWTAIPKDAAAAEIKWQKYMQSSANVSAIAAAVSWVDGCSKKPLLIEELNRGDGKFTLVFTCLGEKDQANSSGIIHFNSYGEGSLFPEKFDRAG